MSLFDSASLVVTPNGYKEDKLYTLKPDFEIGVLPKTAFSLAVTRATTATRVNSDGLIEVTPYNLLQRSEEFNNAIWTKTSGVTITANAIIAPNGTMTADYVQMGSINRVINQTTSFTSLVSVTGSIYIKGTSGQTIQIASGGADQLFTLNGEWQRLESTKTNINGSFNINTFGGATALNFYIWGAQLVSGTSAKEYFPTTDRLHVPRLDYTNSSCPSILVEPQRTNLALRSEEFDNANWVPSSATITSNSAISPSGTLTADTFAGNGTNNLHLIGCSNFTPVGVTTISVFAKKNTNNFIQIIGSSTTFGANVWANFDLNNGVLGSVGSSTTAKIENYGNGWFRCSITGTSSIPATVSFNISLITSATSVRAESNTLSTSVYLWGAQMELGSNATSYVPTVASSVTRNADVISKTGISSLIGQTEGVFYAEIVTNDDIISTQPISLNDGTTSNRILLYIDNSKLYTLVTTGGTLQASISSSTILKNTKYKLAVGYKSNDIVFYVNGVLIGTDTSATIPACSAFSSHNGVATSFYYSKLNSVQLYKTRLTNTELAQLTTI